MGVWTKAWLPIQCALHASRRLRCCLQCGAAVVCMIHVLTIIEWIGLDTVVSLVINITTHGKQSGVDVRCSRSRACFPLSRARRVAVAAPRDPMDPMTCPSFRFRDAKER